MSVSRFTGGKPFMTSTVSSMPNRGAAKTLGLEVWMHRALERASQVERSWDADDVHDLRVALRRCRTMADALGEVSPDSSWRKIKKASRGVFHATGALRDIHVQRAWIKELSPSGDPLRKQLLVALARKERKCRPPAEEALEGFDRKDWRKLLRKAGRKSHFFPPESVVFQRLALAQLNEAVELYRTAVKKRNAASWHRCRIGIKKFRYLVENFLPQRYEAWAADLKRMQDLLGDVHDLDVLRAALARHSSQLDPALCLQFRDRIKAERKARLAEFSARTTGAGSPFAVWRAGFQWGHALVAAPFPRPQRRTA
jgi:CHAD domain-containing protein